MNLSIYYLLILSFKSSLYSWKTTLVTILLIGFLISLVIWSTILQLSLQHIADDYVLPTLKSREAIFTLNKDGYIGNKISETPYFLENDLQQIYTIPGISKITPAIKLTNTTALSSDIISEPVEFNDFLAISEDVAIRLGAASFNFDKGEPIPLVLGVNSLKQWGLPDKEGVLDFKTLKKTHHITRDINNVIGKNITLSFDQILTNRTIFQDTSGGNVLYKPLPNELQTIQEANLRNFIEKYFDYNLLLQPLSLRFKIVAIDYSISPNEVSLPYAAGSYIYERLSSNLLRAMHSAPKSLSNESITIVGQQIIDNEILSLPGSFYGSSGNPIHSLSQSVLLPGLFINGSKGGSMQLITIPIQVPIEKLKSSNIILQAESVENIDSILSELTALGYRNITVHSSLKGLIDYQKNLTSAIGWFKIFLLNLMIIMSCFLCWRLLKNLEASITILRLLGTSKIKVELYTLGAVAWVILLSFLTGLLIGFVLAAMTLWVIGLNLNQTSFFPYSRLLQNYGILLNVPLFNMFYLNIKSVIDLLNQFMASFLIIAIFIVAISIGRLRLDPIALFSKE